MDLEKAHKRAFYLNSLKRLSVLLDTGLSEEQLEVCVELLEKEHVAPDVLARILISLG
jgi:hypothetical protein